jgi:predicted phage terminase large subunit-like protein
MALRASLADLRPEELARLTPEQRARLLELAKRIGPAEGLDAFIRRISPHHPPPRHYPILIEQFERARWDRRVRVCISIPPRHGKTELVKHAIPWWLSASPRDVCAYATYSDRKAWSTSRDIRALAEVAGMRLAADAANVSEWRTPAGGGLLSMGVGAGLTGHGISGLMVVDDPFKNNEEAQSTVYRDKIADWFDSVVMTRLEGAAVFVIHTRWHEDDLIGRVAKRKGWLVINLPAIAEEQDPIGRAPNELLWPERRDLQLAIRESKASNAFTFAALYQGRPRPRGGTVFAAPHYYDPASTNFEGCRFVLAADPAASTKTSADFSAAVVLSVRGDGIDRKAYVRKVYREQVSIPQFAQDLLALQAAYGQTAINVEAVGGFKAIPQMLKAIRPNLRVNEIQPMGDKLTRAQPVASAWNEARVLVPSDAPAWLGPFLDEIEKFTGVNDAHDDQVDALAHAWNATPARSIFDVL